MITYLSLSSKIVRDLYQIDDNPSRAIEFMIRSCGGDFPAPYIVNDRSAKQVINVNISPYAIATLKDFLTLGMTQSQAIEWLVVTYLNKFRIVENAVKKQPKFKKQQNVQQPPTKPSFVHTQVSGPVVKKLKIKPRG
jgi:hypothetical protein